MKHRWSSIIIWPIALLAASWTIGNRVGVSAAARERFAVDLGTLGGNVGEARAINNRGQVVGDASLGPLARHAFLWEKGVMKDLGTLGGDASTAYGVNERGQAVGNSSIEGWGARHACLWDGGRAIDLNPPGAGGSHANAINNQGLIAGYYSAPNFRLRACIWRDGAMVDLGFPEDSTSMALAVNDRGQVVGYCQPDLPTMCGFLWENGSLVDVGPCVQNPASALATGINNRGQVVNIRSYGPLPFLWDSGSMTDLTLVPYAINNLTVVAGAFIASDGRYHPGLWVDGTLTDLGNGLGFGGLARAVNDLGDAVGFAWRQADQRQGMRPFLWTTR